MKVFISHKKEDAIPALALKEEFRKKGVDTYLDLLDSSIISDGKKLTDHIKNNLNSCTDIVVVMSENTRYSWWVPFEIGMSAQADMPTASYLKSEVELPSYLSYWPRLRSLADVDKYVSTRKRIEQQTIREYGRTMFAEQKTIETRRFYEALKAELR